MQVDGDTSIRVNAFTGLVLPDGTPVRVQLDNPIDYVSGSRLHGKFRAGDIRWENKIRHITRLYLRPGQPPMYQVEDDGHVAYTKINCRLCKTMKSDQPTSHRKIIIKRLSRRFKNKIMYEVLWDTGETTVEPRSSLMKDVPDMIDAFENA